MIFSKINQRKLEIKRLYYIQFYLKLYREIFLKYTIKKKYFRVNNLSSTSSFSEERNSLNKQKFTKKSMHTKSHTLRINKIKQTKCLN